MGMNGKSNNKDKYLEDVDLFYNANDSIDIVFGSNVNVTAQGNNTRLF